MNTTANLTDPAPQDTTLLTVRTLGETLTVSSLDFASGLGVQHKNLLDTIRTHQAAIEADFGLIAFETRKTAQKDSAFQTPNLLPPVKRSTKPMTVAHLTEDQALFLGTLSRNSGRVVAFKATLVRSFSQARRQLREAAQLLIPTDHLAQHDQRIKELEHKLTQILLNQQQAARLLLDVPRSSEAVPEETTRSKVQRIVNAYCNAKAIKQQEVWRQVYQSLYYRYKINIRAHKRSERESWLDVIDRKGYMDKIYAIVSQELQPDS